MAANGMVACKMCVSERAKRECMDMQEVSVFVSKGWEWLGGMVKPGKRRYM